MSTGRNRIGCCAACDGEVYEVLERWTGDHPGAGDPKRLGRPKAAARRVEFGISDGTRCDITLCAACAEVAGRPDSLRTIWRNAMSAFDHETEHRVAYGARPLKPRQDERVRADVRRLKRLHLTGVLAVTEFRETADG